LVSGEKIVTSVGVLNKNAVAISFSSKTSYNSLQHDNISRNVSKYTIISSVINRTYNTPNIYATYMQHW